jgi:hypothetical protein
MLRGGGGFSRGFLAITFVEAIYASSGINQLLFPGKERVASGTDFDVQVTFARRAGLERFAASAGDGYFDVFGVYSWFHFVTLDQRPQAAFCKRTMIEVTGIYRQVCKDFLAQRRKDAKL